MYIYIVTILYQNFMVTENQKSTKDIYKKTNRITNSTLKIPILSLDKITKKKKKRGREEKRPSKTNPQMAIATYISIFSLNVNGLNAPPKRYTLVGWIQKQTHMCAVYQRPTSDLETHID